MCTTLTSYTESKNSQFRKYKIDIRELWAEKYKVREEADSSDAL